MGPEPGPGALRPAGPGVGASVPASPRLDLATPGPLHPDGRSPTESCAWRRGEVGGGFLHDPLHRPLVPFPSRSGSRRPPPHPKSRPKSLPALRWLLEGPSSLSDPSPGAPSGRPFLSFPLRAPRSPSPELPSAGPGGGGGTPPPAAPPPSCTITAGLLLGRHAPGSRGRARSPLRRARGKDGNLLGLAPEGRAELTWALLSAMAPPGSSASAVRLTPLPPPPPSSRSARSGRAGGAHCACAAAPVAGREGRGGEGMGGAVAPLRLRREGAALRGWRRGCWSLGVLVGKRSRLMVFLWVGGLGEAG